MKKLFLSLSLCCSILSLYSQSASVEKYTNGVQVGVLGIWAYTESALGNEISIRTEAGFSGGMLEVSSDETRFILTPEASIEPRWYYNLNKRAERSSNTDDNAANFISLKGGYRPNWYTIPLYKDIQVIEELSLVPTWGIRRNVGEHLNYEAGLGVGYRYIFAKAAGYSSNVGDIAVNLHLRFGYKF